MILLLLVVVVVVVVVVRREEVVVELEILLFEKSTLEFSPILSIPLTPMKPLGRRVVVRPNMLLLVVVVVVVVVVVLLLMRLVVLVVFCLFVSWNHKHAFCQTEKHRQIENIYYNIKNICNRTQ